MRRARILAWLTFYALSAAVFITAAGLYLLGLYRNLARG